MRKSFLVRMAFIGLPVAIERAIDAIERFGIAFLGRSDGYQACIFRIGNIFFCEAFSIRRSKRDRSIGIGVFVFLLHFHRIKFSGFLSVSFEVVIGIGVWGRRGVCESCWQHLHCTSSDLDA